MHRLIRRVLGGQVDLISTKRLAGHPPEASDIGVMCTFLVLRGGVVPVVPSTATSASIYLGIDVGAVTKASRTGVFRAAVGNSLDFGGQTAVLVTLT
ncbi:hypothetical protein [Lentzea sp. NPDC004782]|uniref:hypothetical protein n=1 Tax=Lentzea sp. NPDC004782 TaxID=3154458 RepID=UPI0033AB7453